MTWRIEQAEALEFMAGLPEQSIDLIATDPPYIGLKGGYATLGHGVGKDNRCSTTVGDKWDASLDWIPEAKRVARLGAMVFCSYHFVDIVAAAFSDWRKVGLLTWYKRNAPHTGANVPHFNTEFIWLFAKRPGLKWDSFKTMCFDIPNLQAGCMASERIVDAQGHALHPTQKPVALMLELLKVNPNSVLDPFCGSGSTGVACIQTGRNFIGIEIDAGYAAIARKRCEAAAMQGRLL